MKKIKIKHRESQIEVPVIEKNCTNSRPKHQGRE